MKILCLLLFLGICQCFDTIQNLVANNITYSAFQLRWPASNQTEEYSIEIKKEDINQTSTILVDTSINCSVTCEYNFSEAPPNTLILATVFAKQGNKLRYNFSTKALPNAKFQIDKVTQNGFIISWNPSDSFLKNGGSFGVQITKNNLSLDSFNITRNFKNYTFNQGKSLTTYKLKITALYKNFQGKSVVKTIETDFPINLVVKNITETGFTIVWDKNQNFISNGGLYHIEIIEENLVNPLNITKEVINNEYEFKNGRPLTVYNITIFSKYKSYAGEPTTESIETEPEVPGPPLNFSYKVTGSNVDIKWEPPNVKEGTIKNYTVSIYDLGIQFGEECKDIEQKNFTNTTKNTFYSTSLLRFHEYKFIIVANTRSRSGEGLHAIIKTNATEIKEPIIKIEDLVTEITKGRYNVSRRLIVSSQCNPGPIDYYKIEVNPSENISVHYTNSTEFTMPLENLKPWFNYTITVTSITFQQNLRNKSSVESFSTPEGFPGPPQSIYYLENGNELVIQWKEPEERTGLILYYHIYLEHVGIRDHGFDCNGQTSYTNYTTINGNDSLKQTFKFSQFHKYNVNINAETRKGIGKNASRPILTGPTKPEPPTGISYCINQDSNEQTTLLLSFKSPCKSNGKFERYEVKVNGVIQTLYRNITTTWIISPEVPIRISVVIYSSQFMSSTEETLLPSVPRISNTIELPIVNNETNLIEFTLKKSDFDGYDKIVGFLLMVTNDSMISNDTTTKWILYEGQVCKNKINTTDIKNLPIPSNNTKLIHSEYIRDPFQKRKIYICPVEYSEDFNCIRVPLQEQMEYFLIIRVFTKHFYGDSQKLSFRTGTYPTYTLQLALGISFGLLFIFALTSLAMFYYYKINHPIFSKFQNPKQDRLLANSTEEYEYQKCLPSEFPIYLKKLKSTENGLKTQFSNLGKLSQEISSSNTTQVAQLPQNRKKNRYINILPYDSTRVILPDDEYINASYIKGKSGYVEYIACQGPMKHTCKDFWHMVLHEKVSIIVMITQFTENKKDKCFEYFPSLNASMIEEDMTITCVAEESCSDHFLKKLEIENEETIVTVDHFQFLNWPDFGVPTTTECILKFVKEVRKMYKHGKILVHCSAGVGRTGTFITLDISMATIDRQQEIDIYNMVLNLRKQRCLMVQTLAQYEYIHDCLANYINFEQESIM